MTMEKGRNEQRGDVEEKRGGGGEEKRRGEEEEQSGVSSVFTCRERGAVTAAPLRGPPLISFDWSRPLDKHYYCFILYTCSSRSPSAIL